MLRTSERWLSATDLEEGEEEGDGGDEEEGDGEGDEEEGEEEEDEEEGEEEDEHYPDGERHDREEEDEDTVLGVRFEEERNVDRYGDIDS